MVYAYHLIWTAYGWWLPNDPRGSMSRTIRDDMIAELGELHYGRKRLQPASRDIRAFYENAKQYLQNELLTFTDSDIGMMAQGFGQVVKEKGYTCYACALMPDHVHLVMRKHRDPAEEMIDHFQRESRTSILLLKQRNPFHPVWGGPGWKVFLDDVASIERTVKYVEDNPKKARLLSQNWEFVTKYDGWPFHKRKR